MLSFFFDSRYVYKLSRNQFILYDIGLWTQDTLTLFFYYIWTQIIVMSLMYCITTHFFDEYLDIYINIIQTNFMFVRSFVCIHT